MTPSPRVSVVMSVYNGEKYLAQAIESILDQTFRDYEFIIIDDGSTDGTGVILRQYEEKDDRIQVYDQENKGLIASLNRGCRLAKGEFVARMDADDISLPQRFVTQVQYLDAHPEIGVLGTWMEFIAGAGSTKSKFIMPTSSGLLGWSLIFGNCMAHPSIMMRRDIVERLGFYDPEALHVEDYDLWARAIAVTRIGNIPEVLLQRRVWEDMISLRHEDLQEQNVVKVIYAIILRLLRTEIPLEDVVSLRRMAMGFEVTSVQQIMALASLIQRLYWAYLKAHSLSRGEARLVARDAGRKLSKLAIFASKTSRRKGLVLFFQALRLSPEIVLSKELLKKGAGTLVRRS